MSRYPSYDYKTYRVTVTISLDVEVPPDYGPDERHEYAAEMAEVWMEEFAPEVDYTVTETYDVTREVDD